MSSTRCAGPRKTVRPPLSTSPSGLTSSWWSGGGASNNTRQLVATCAKYCARVHQVETDADVQLEWFDAVDAVGLTAGTSTPDDVINRVEARIRLCGDRSVPSMIAMGSQ